MNLHTDLVEKEQEKICLDSNVTIILFAHSYTCKLWWLLSLLPEYYWWFFLYKPEDIFFLLALNSLLNAVTVALDSSSPNISSHKMIALAVLLIARQITRTNWHFNVFRVLCVLCVRAHRRMNLILLLGHLESHPPTPMNFNHSTAHMDSILVLFNSDLCECWAVGYMAHLWTFADGSAWRVV